MPGCDMDEIPSHSTSQISSGSLSFVHLELEMGNPLHDAVTESRRGVNYLQLHTESVPCLLSTAQMQSNFMPLLMLYLASYWESARQEAVTEVEVALEAEAESEKPCDVEINWKFLQAASARR